ncbi:MAG TPA: SusC/RagA family TonB-linked outer membrane protein [Gemmatimonadales bacterium]|nr:SusC/RagA family TonB-linked outer membrane protein [Gemmatimonadales bacterium]
MGTRVLRQVVLGIMLFVVPAAASAQDRRITGRVTKAGSDTPIPDAEVSVVGQPRYAAARSGEDGRFTITVPAGELRLQARAIGYTRLEITVASGQSTADLAMQQDIFRLSEVVVTGQATTIERRSATTDIAYVSGEDISKVSSPSILNALTGKISGVNLQTNSGAPGGGIQMQIRGNTTILGAFDPLYVVDGVMYSNASIPSGRGFVNAAASTTLEADPVNRIADLNPADIASIEVLKGAAASSIYGSKASNGVVVITTIRGQAGRTRVNVAQRFGVYSPLRLLEERRWTQDSAVARFGAAAAAFFEGNATPYFSQYGQVYSNRDLSYETVADVSGGTPATRYYISGSWKRDEGIELNTGASRQTLRVNVDQDLSRRVDLKLSSVYTRSESDRGWNNNCNNYGCHGYAMAYIPSFVDFRRRNPDGTYVPPSVGVQSNPLQLTELGVNHEEVNRFTGGLTAGWNAWSSASQSLRLIAGGGVDVFNQSNDVWSPNDLFFEVPQALPGESVESGGRSRFFNWNVNGIHTWRARRWSATTSLGIQYSEASLNTFLIRTQNLLPGQRNVNQGTNITATEALTQERTLAFYAQEELRLLEDRLLLQVGARAERSSVNGDIDKYFVFPKVSGSYRFADLVGAGSEVKVRAAYGETGNQPLFGQKFTNLFTPQLGGTQGVTVSTAAGFAGVEPERLKEVEGGLDGSALDGRLTWTLTAYTRNTTNLLLQRVPAPSSGFTSQVFNGGKLNNKGVEVALGYTPINNTRTQWITRGTFTRYTSEVVDLAGLPAFFPTASGFGNLGRTRIEEGKPITQIVGFNFDEAGNRAATLSQLGNSAPDFRVGWVNDISHGSLTLSVVLDWQQGGDVINLTQFLMDDGRTSADWGTEAGLKRYQGYLKGVIAPYIEDATFLKLREVSVGVDIPRSVIGGMNLGIETMRVSLSGRNLWMSAKYSGLDPEVANFGAAAIRNNLDIGPYPPSRSVFFNIAVGF